MVSDLRSGRFNVLVATCIGEEGLDVGEVDLIVHYDVISNSTRQVGRPVGAATTTGPRLTHLSVCVAGCCRCSATAARVGVVQGGWCSSTCPET